MKLRLLISYFQKAEIFMNDLCGLSVITSILKVVKGSRKSQDLRVNFTRKTELSSMVALKIEEGHRPSHASSL